MRKDSNAQMTKKEEHIIDEEKPLSLSPQIEEKKLKRLLDDDDYLPVGDDICDIPEEMKVPYEEDCEYDNSASLKSIAERDARKEKEKAQEEELKRKDEEYKNNPEDDILKKPVTLEIYEFGAGGSYQVSNENREKIKRTFNTIDELAIALQ